MNRSRTFLKSLAVALLLGASLAFGSHAFAQVVDPSSDLASFGEAAGFVTTGSLTLTIARLIRTAITFLGILAVTFVLYGGFLFMTAGGNDDKVKRAKKVFTSAIIGLVIILSSFAIVQFVLGQLTTALEGSTTTTDGGDGDYPDGTTGGSSGTFELTSLNTDCAAAIKNLQLQFTFSQRVSSSTVDAGGILVSAADGTAVDGSYSVSGTRVTFTPTATCADDGYPDENCFDAGADYSVSLDDAVLESTAGLSLTCSDTYPCSYDFTTGTAVDTAGPTMAMDSPESGAQVYVNDIQDLQSYAVDDTGVSAVDFTVDGDIVYQAALSTDSTEGALSPENYFLTGDGTQWDTAGYSTGSYKIRAEGADCAGHSDTSEAVTIELRAAHCGNETMDEDETDIDCGGDDCGACDAESCDSNDDCSSGYCDGEIDPATGLVINGVCVGIPEIEGVSPGDGAEGNLITIEGSNFGATAGSITFLGDASTTSDDVEVSAYECEGVSQWADEQIVVQVPSGAIDGPILLTTSDNYGDQTDDDYGPTISDFDVNGIVRPGLCSLDPSTGEGFSAVTISGIKLGDDQGSSTVYFSNDEAYEYAAWDDQEISAVLPLLNARDYQTQVWSGDYECLDASGATTGDTCSDDTDCTDLGYASCQTMQCSETLTDCESDDDCADGEECVSVRQGSNELTFTVTDASSGETPVISSTDSGWEACSDGTHCGADADCSTGTCDAADNWGPPGQYVTIYGSGFGSATGTVHFTDDLGYANGVIDDFPDACGDDFWDDTQITVKVPERYTNIDSDGDGTGDDITSFGTFELTVETAQSAESDSVDFVIRDDEPGPGVCAIDPVSGPAGTTTVTINGDNFVSPQGSGAVEFYNGEVVTSTTYWNDTEVRTLVASGAESGPVFVTADSGFDSNSQNFEISDCEGDDANCSVTGTQCCSDGSCSATCEQEVDDSHYAWMFSTADIPAAPRVLTYCGDRDDDGSYDGVSPGPSNGWSQQADICVGTAVTATFSVAMDTTTFDANISVATADGTAVAGAVVPSASPYTFQWIPTDNGGEFLPNTTYVVTIESDGILSADGVAMVRDYSWEFTTANSTDPCVIGSVYASPSTYTATAANETVDYLAQPISAEDECVPLACTDYAWDWASSDEDDATVSPESIALGDACTTTATALAETSGTPVDISATATNPDGRDPSDSGELTINFTDPEVTSWTPSCETACVNGAIDVTFNTDMDDVFDAGTTVVLYECEDALCDTVSEGDEFADTYTVTAFDHTTHSFQVTHDDFAASTWYRVVIDGGVTSTSGVELSESGSNYPSTSNLYYEDDFSWTFKTKSSDAPCAVDRVEVSPSSAETTYIGEQSLWRAIPYGATDDCSASGQELDASDYDWSAWTAADEPDVHVGTEEVAEMISAGSLLLTSELENGCSSDCLHIGSAATTDDAVCGDGDIQYGEECDGGSNCSSDCLNEGSTQCTYSCDTSGASCTSDSTCSETCDTATGFCTTNTSTACVSDADCPYASGACVQDTGCCGDGTKDGDEECDDGNSSNNDGCSTSCLNNGARKAATTCGDGTTDQSSTTGGEDCDDDNATSGDGCSSDCLYEGGVALDGIYATCGNGSVEEGEDCEDPSTDSDKVDDGDGCSSECLFEGASECVYECQTSAGVSNGVNCSGYSDTTCASGYTCQAAVSPCCGDGLTDYSAVSGAWSDESEDCDDGNAEDGDGCSSSCLSEGSDENYSTPSYCGNGTVDYTDATSGGEECDAASGYSLDVSYWGVSRILDAAAQEVVDGRAGAIITAGVSAPVVTGEGDLSLTCSCELDSACGDETAYGCGTGSCCFVRPEEDSRYPADTQSDVCLNTSVYVDFTDAMDATSLAPEGEIPNMYLELTELDGGATTVTQTNCPYTDGWIQVAGSGRVSSSWIARAIDWIASSVRQLFGRGANAATYACVVPVNFSLGSNSVGGTRVTMSFDDALEEDATYAFTVTKDADESDASADGVLSVNGVSVMLTGSTNGDTTEFETGSEICTLDVVETEDLGTVASITDELADPSVGYFTEDGETHLLQATAYTVSGGSLKPISETSAYGWSWTWGTSVDDTDTASDIVSLTSADATSAVATASGITGRETAEAQANFLSTNTFGETSGGVNGSVALTANVCDNPPTVGFPYTDSTSNFSFFYCKDAGVEGDTTDDLPELDAVVDVTSYTGDIIQELIFPVDGTSDAIGVRVLKNESYLSPAAWFDEQGFTGSATPTNVDGYEAVQDGNTVYVAASNYSSSSVLLYPNIYVISYTEDADTESQQIFDQILENWTFNANDTYVTDVNLCVSSDGSYPTDADGSFVTCDWDGDCVDVGTGATCDAEKAKLTRDTKRLTDVTDIIASVEAYADATGYCSSTTDQECTADSECPGSETCEPATPTLQSGTFVAPYSVSAWPSWSATLGNALGEALPEDPVNAFYDCTDAGYEADTCWNATDATFLCPSGSHVYGYKSVGGTAYELNAQLEFGDALWAYDIEPTTDTFETVNVSQPYTGSSTPMSGFVRAASDTFCGGTTIGSSAICGDGIRNSDTSSASYEACEIGETDSIDCASAGGTITVTCESDCSGFQTETEAVAAGAECVAFECGNGVTEADNGEECDDGSLNGSYGHCGSDCTTDTAYTCGDGYLAGGEQCDCGSTTTFSDVMADASSWAYAYCDTASNGQWISDPDVSCSWDCQAPGPSCGDSEINGSEVCDGDYDSWSGALCYGGDDDGEACTTDSECDSGVCGSDGVSPDTYDACGSSKVCDADGNGDGLTDLGASSACSSDSDCDALVSGDALGTCSAFSYDLERTRTCQSTCDWDTSTPGGWTECLGGSQVCGDGAVDGNEECDDGNTDDTDACTSSCVLNVCGDAHVYSGVESCDSGNRNGEECDAPYEGTCNYCTTSCQYKTTSGTYCGDGEVNGSEFCDGTDLPAYCIDTSTGSIDRSGTCDAANEGTSTGCDSGYTCHFMGVCDGGTASGEECLYTYDATDPDINADCILGGGECIAPTCADDCASMCPFTFETASVQAQTEDVGSSPEDSVELYSYTSGYSPNNATFYIPACTAATGLTADVDTSNVNPPSMAVYFLTDYTGTMANDINGDSPTTSGLPSRIDIVSAAEADAIESLYDALGTDYIQIGLMRIGSTYASGGVYGGDGYTIDAELGAQTKEELIATVEEYALETDLTSGYGPPMYAGLKAAIDALDATDAEVKAIVLLSDGETYIGSDSRACSVTNGYDVSGTCQSGSAWSCGEPDSSSGKNYYCCTEQVDKGLLSSCSADSTDGAVRGSGSVSVYTAAITETASNVYAAYMAHMSSETCGTDYSNVDDCGTGTYAFSAQNEEGVATMYESIIDNLLNVTVQVTSDFTGTSRTDTGTVGDGHGLALPFPEGFDCDGEAMAIPFTLTFNGDGYVTLDNIEVTYCPAP